MTQDVAGSNRPRGKPKMEKATCKAGGWTFESCKGSISDEAYLKELSSSLNHPVSLPEMVYGSSYLELTHDATGMTLRFDAKGALEGWQEERLPPLQLSRATQWKASRLQEIAQSRARVLEYDWTYTTNYKGAARDGRGCNVGGAFVETAQQIDRPMLMARDPITFIESVPLYESEMDDNGVSACTVRIRVMPKCWFVLLRFWLRVDDMIVRLRDVRYFGKFEWGPRVLREVKYSEGTFAELGVNEGPSSNVTFADGDAASQVLEALAPVGVKLYKNELLELSSDMPANT